jgi:hypothetical protein
VELFIGRFKSADGRLDYFRSAAVRVAAIRQAARSIRRAKAIVTIQHRESGGSVSMGAVELTFSSATSSDVGTLGLAANRR